MAAIALQTPSRPAVMPPPVGAPAPPVEKPAAAPPAAGGTSAGASGASADVVADGAAGATGGTDTPAETPAALDKLARAKLAGERAIADAQRRRAKQDADTKAANEAAQLRADNARLTREATDARTAADPNAPIAERTAALKRMGFTPQQIAQAAIADGTPEAKLAAELAPLKSELEQLRTWKQEREKAETSAKANAEFAKAQSAFVTQAKDATRYPNLATQPEFAILALTKDLVSQISPADRDAITDDDLCEWLESKYAGHTTAPAKANVTGSETPTDSTPNENAASATPRTISAKLAPPQPLPALPANWDQLSREEQVAYMGNQLRAKKPTK